MYHDLNSVLTPYWGRQCEEKSGKANRIRLARAQRKFTHYTTSSARPRALFALLHPPSAIATPLLSMRVLFHSYVHVSFTLDKPSKYFWAVAVAVVVKLGMTLRRRHCRRPGSNRRWDSFVNTTRT